MAKASDRGAVAVASAEPRGENVVDILNPDGKGPIVLVCEHASNHIPPEFGDLGLAAEARLSHIAWDPGAYPVAKAMSALLDAPLLSPRVSRLVYDCNRPPEAESAMPARSEIFDVPGNAGLDAAQRAARATRFYHPFREALAAFLDRRIAAGETPVLITVHSFTPVYNGVPRHLDVGILHDADSRLADAMLELCGGATDLRFRRNQPYGPDDGVTHTLRLHALPRGLMNVMIEIRNDLIAESGSQRAMAERLSRCASGALAALGGGTARPRTAG